MWRDQAYLLTRGQFGRSKIHHYAIIRTLEVIGEAAGKVSQDFRDAHPEIPWKDLISMRNRLIHEYFQIDLDKVWDTVQKDIPSLIRLIEPLVPPENGDPRPYPPTKSAFLLSAWNPIAASPCKRSNLCRTTSLTGGPPRAF